MAHNTKAEPKVFIVYKSQDETRDEWVFRFYTDLRTEHGVDAIIDQYDVDLGESFREHMELIRDPDVDAALFVITPPFYEAAYQSRVGPVYHERQLAQSRKDKDRSFKVIEIYRENCAAYDMTYPDPRYIDFRDDTEYEERLEKLAASLWERSRKPPLGRPVEDEVEAADEAPDFAAIHDDLLSPDITVLYAAAEKVKEQGLDTVEAHAVALRDRLADKSADRRDAAAWALGELGDKRAVEPLIAALQDEDEDVRWAATWALGPLSDERAVEPLIAALQDQVGLVRGEAAEALGDIGDERAVEPLIAALQDEDEPTLVHRAAAGALGKIADTRGLQPMLKALKDENSDVRRAAARALVQIGDEQAVEPLIAVLDDEHPGVRWAAVRALAHIGDEQAAEPVIAVLQDEEEFPVVRRATVAALEQFGEVAVEALLAVLQADDSGVRSATAETLGDIGDERAVEPLIDVMQDQEGPPLVRWTAARALGKIRDERAVPALIETLEDDGAVRSGAAWALEHFDTAEARKALEEYRRETEEEET